MAQKLVLIDDQPVFRQVVRDIVEGHFDIVAQPDSFDAAIAAIANHEPAGVIVDVNLDARFAGRDGLQLARELIDRHPNLKIILVSGYMENVYASMARSIPRTVFIDKAALTSDFLHAALAED